VSGVADASINIVFIRVVSCSVAFSVIVVFGVACSVTVSGGKNSFAEPEHDDIVKINDAAKMTKKAFFIAFNTDIPPFYINEQVNILRLLLHDSLVKLNISTELTYE
jgi:hypothetical protein